MGMYQPFDEQEKPGDSGVDAQSIEETPVVNEIEQPVLPTVPVASEGGEILGAREVIGGEGEVARDEAMHAYEPMVLEEELEGGAPWEAIPLPALPADEKILDRLILRSRIDRFWQRTEEAQSRINREINNVELATYLLNLIQQARNYLLAGKENFEEADRLLAEVEHRLDFMPRMRESSRKYAPWILAYEVLWLLFLGAMFYFVNIAPSASLISHMVMSVNVAQLINSMIWGAMGGIVGALFVLWRHVADRQDFDHQHALWYYTNPILGVPLGAFIFIVIQAGFFTLTAGGGSDVTAINSALVVYLLAWVAGFRQNLVYDLVRRILDVFRVETSTSSVSGASGRETATPGAGRG
ncbi:MAG: hypothetical protein WHV66_05550 [Anaerolineales bacterium]